MQLSTAALLFAAVAMATATTAISNLFTGQYALSDGSNMHNLIDGIHARIGDGQATNMVDPRQKRSLTAFWGAWRRLLRTTIGSVNIHEYTPDGKFAPANLFYSVKAGTLDDATRDFYSLGVKNVVQVPEGLKGVAEKKLVTLIETPPGIGVADTNRPKLVIRAIEYRKTFAEANALLKSMQDLKSMQ